jgi:hypothetical protein
MKISRAQWIYLVSALAVLTVAVWPMRLLVQENTASEDGRYFRRVYADQTVGQTINIPEKADTVELFARGQKQSTAIISLTDGEQHVLGMATVELGTTDRWISIPLRASLPAGERTFIIHAAGADKATALLVRYQVDSGAYAAGYMIVNGQQSYGDVAFRAIQKAPAWKAWAARTGITSAQTRKMGLIAIGSFLLAGLAVRLPRDISPAAWRAALIALAAAAICLRLSIVPAIDGVYGGDVFNYVGKADALLHGEDLFAADPRKGPVWAAVIAPTLLLPDPMLAIRLIGVVISAAAVALAAATVRRWGVAYPLALAAGGLLAVNRDFIWESVSGLANSLFAAEIVGVLYLCTRAASGKTRLSISILLGALALTRFEGIVLAPAVLCWLWWRHRFPWREFVKISAIAAGIILLPQVSLLWSGVSGIRTPADIVGDGGLQLARTWEDLAPNLQALRQFVSRQWIITRPVGGVFTYAASGFLAGLAIGPLAAVFKDKRVAANLKALALWGMVAACFVIASGTNSLAIKIIALAPSAIVGFGAARLLAERSGQGALALLILIPQLIIITLILPKPRYYLPAIPIFNMVLVWGLYSLSGWRWARTKIPSLGLVIFFSAFVHLDAQRAIGGALEEYNREAADAAVLMKSYRWLREAQGMVAWRDGELPVMMYLPRPRRISYRGWSKTVTADEEMAWFKEHHVRYIVDNNHSDHWHVVADKAEQLKAMATFKSDVGSATATVYKVN